MTPKLRFFIQTLVKVTILFLSAGFLYLQLWDKINTTEFWSSFSNIFSDNISILYIIVVFCLMFLNWGLEVFKWYLLTSVFSNTSLRVCIKGVLSGITISMFLPNRTGDFAGRILWIRKRFRWKGLYANIYSSSSQVLATIIFGTCCILFVPNTIMSITNVNNISIVSSQTIAVFLCTISIILYLTFPIIIQKTEILKKNNSYRFIQHLSIFSEFKLTLLFNILSISLFRFLIYCFQFFLVLRVLQINISFLLLFPYIAVMFFIITIVPKFAIVEIATRGAIAIMIIGTALSDLHVNHEATGAVFTASTIMWVINLFTPAMFGLFFLPPFVKSVKRKT
jgi:hypothetical protein